eukprot:CAMPEP_0174836394 /NCGR_PEP_ID=MMETSP1114-20130205/6041_1 /TAXON_ID=312471 /ORGANISM="Neobodo designis, Strain CCAP 1951/1" /LENGTH=104 /DNA_ID=CAMNT_0016070389 /DNA_START=26 /DNA_END=341 /DNA_ORIENTATION=-
MDITHENVGDTRHVQSTLDNRRKVASRSTARVLHTTLDVAEKVPSHVTVRNRGSLTTDGEGEVCRPKRSFRDADCQKALRHRLKKNQAPVGMCANVKKGRAKKH